MEAKTPVTISRKAFLQSALVLLLLMLMAGVLTRLVPAGHFARIMIDGREVIDPASFHLIEQPEYPIWRWLTAPFEVLAGPDGFTIIVISIFVLCVAISFGMLESTGIVRTLISSVVRRFRDRKYLLLSLITLVFMLMGATFGILEEIVPIVPIMVALSYSMGWDALVGLGMSILAVNLGFSAALFNPFTIGIAQQIAELPLFSGVFFRLPIFMAMYAIALAFLLRYARRIESNPHDSLVFHEDHGHRQRAMNLQVLDHDSPSLQRAAVGFGVFLILLFVFLILVPLLEGVSDYVLPMVGILFFTGAALAAVHAGATMRAVLQAAWAGTLGILPALPLLLMATSIKYIVEQGAILDTLLHSAASVLQNTSPQLAILLMLLVTLMLEIFISAGSAKAILMMPILIPLADLAGLTRQSTVLAYALGDGIANLTYPTNPVLLITLGLTVVSYPTWMRWTARVWVGVLIITVAALWAAVSIGYGPF